MGGCSSCPAHACVPAESGKSQPPGEAHVLRTLVRTACTVLESAEGSNMDMPGGFRSWKVKR